MPEKLAITDLRHLRCPMAFVQAKMAIIERCRSQPLVLLLSDPGTRQDVPRWLDKNQIKYCIQADTASGMTIQITG
ncbi:sulfurtransferase TusA family protein [uncultured Ferrimonas sp.]|uniref:sulfurtransferase TusA family protein n=1 Tax=uncultured Ferrimonas sp. TaxID=432640 RepID=UPI0026385E43|nr:sulfurtransferase TusA family protein [uncultured Ferrimonas sp.]